MFIAIVASNKFNYEPGTTYEFEYETELLTSLQGAAKDHAGVKLTAIVHLEFKSKCELSMKVCTYYSLLYTRGL